MTDELYEIDPREFVAARDRLAKERRASGDRDGATAIRALRRPSVSAWALNQVARRHADAIDELVATVEQVRTAQDQVLAGDDRDLLRDALANRRRALHAVTERARAVVEQSGRSGDAAIRDIETALQAPPTPAFVDALRRGELTDLDTSGDDDQLSALLSASTSDVPPAPLSAAARARRDKVAEEVRQLERAADAASAALTEAAQQADARERDALHARQARDDAQRVYDRARKALEQAWAKLDDH